MWRMNHILIVDDDRDLVDLMRQYLEGEGFVVEAAIDYASGLEAALSGNHELVILDVNLPGGSGFELLKKLRAESNLPVVLLTARGDSVDRIVGLHIGADDYVPKPFEPREVVARIRAVLRRTRAGMEKTGSDDRIVVGDVTLSPSTRTANAGRPGAGIDYGGIRPIRGFAAQRRKGSHPRPTRAGRSRAEPRTLRPRCRCSPKQAEEKARRWTVLAGSYQDGSRLRIHLRGP